MTDVIGHLAIDEAPEIVYLVVCHYFPKFETDTGGGYVVECNIEDIKELLDEVREGIQCDKKEEISIHLKIKKSLEKRTLNEFIQLSPMLKSNINKKFVLNAVHRYLLYDEPIAILQNIPTDLKQIA